MVKGKGQGKDKGKASASSAGAPEVYVSPKLNADRCFVIRHFAGSVTYEIDEFLEKNNDSLVDDLEDALMATNNKFVIGQW